MRPGSTVSVPVTRIGHEGKKTDGLDTLATEEPMEIRLISYFGDRQNSNSISVTMRTPGNDFELAAGFLLTEGVITNTEESIESISYCTDPKEIQNYNIVNVRLKPSVKFEMERLSRHFYTNSSCGVCGKASLDLVRTVCPSLPVGDFKISRELLRTLPQKLGNAQKLFSITGGLHACALFDVAGNLIAIREDVGRHNAIDKLIGSMLLQKKLPASNRIVLVSGRASFELVQKSLMAGIPVLASVGAPSSLAVDLAKEYGMTLIGFLRHDRYNIYAGFEDRF